MQLSIRREMSNDGRPRLTVYRLRPDDGLCQSITSLWTFPQRNDMPVMFYSRISTSWNAKRGTFQNAMRLAHQPAKR
jgi:hypothetical protein